MFVLYKEQHIGIYAHGVLGRTYVRMRLRDLIAKLRLQIVDTDDLSQCRELIDRFDTLADNAGESDSVLVARATDLLQKYTLPTLKWRVGIGDLRLERDYG